MNGALADAEMWSAYWESVGWPNDARAARLWWKAPGPLPDGPSLLLFRSFAPVAVQLLIRDCGLPAAWLATTLPPP